jgi:SAM-dependent methyltransferase
VSEKQAYDGIAGIYDEIFARDADHQQEARKLLTELKSRGVKATRVLDFGCGTGLQAEALLDVGTQYVYAHDVSESMIEVCRNRLGRFNAERWDCGTAMPSIAADLDLVAAQFYVVNHFLEESDFRSFAEVCSRSLGADGAVLFDCYNSAAVFSDPPRSYEKTVQAGGAPMQKRCTPHLSGDRMTLSYEMVGRPDLAATWQLHVRLWSEEQIREFMKGFRITRFGLGFAPPEAKNYHSLYLCQR